MFLEIVISIISATVSRYRESVPLCEHIDRGDKELEKACLIDNKTNYNKYFWDVRDFNVDVDIIDGKRLMCSFLYGGKP